MDQIVLTWKQASVFLFPEYKSAAKELAKCTCLPTLSMECWGSVLIQEAAGCFGATDQIGESQAMLSDTSLFALEIFF